MNSQSRSNPNRIFRPSHDPDGTYLKSVDRFLLEPDAVAKKIVKIIKKHKRELNLQILLPRAQILYPLSPNS